MNKLEELFKKSFYTMAFIRTLACVIFLALAMSCKTPSFYIQAETDRYNKSLETHSIHWEEGTYCIGCPYPNKFNTESTIHSNHWRY